MKYSIELEALAELEDAVAFYESRQVGAGTRLVDAVDEAIQRICEYPEAWPPIRGNLRRGDVDGYPYWLVYSHTAEGATVTVIGHTSRGPDYWHARLRR